MRYILDGDFASEKISRLKYLYTVFGVFFIERFEPKEQSASIKWNNNMGSVFVSIPSTYANDICIIYGHNRFAELVLKKHQNIIPEKKIFIIACKADVNWDCIKGNKEIYFPRMETDVENRYSKEDFQMDFHPTDPEINLYNLSSEITPFKALCWAFELDR